MNSASDTLWKIYEGINGWIRFADTKATVILGINGILAGFVVKNPTSLKMALLENMWLLVIAIAAGLSSLISVYFSTKCLKPTLKVGEPTSLIYYAHIALQFGSPDDYYQQAIKTFGDNVEVSKQIAHQVWANSIVAWKKYKAVTWSIWFLILSLLLGLAGLIVGLL